MTYPEMLDHFDRMKHVRFEITSYWPNQEYRCVECREIVLAESEGQGGNAT